MAPNPLSDPGSPARRPAPAERPGGDPWARRWAQLARGANLRSDERPIVALSGGADSVLLLQFAAAARPRPDLLAAHVHHGLRGPAADADARFCASLCASLGIPFVELRAELDPQPAGLEERAREARYTLLVDLARRTGRNLILTGHHADDGLETLLLRWLRGSHLGGLAPGRAELWIHGAYPGAPPQAGPALAPVRVVRPLRTLRREEVRRLLEDRGLAWREDRSNEDPTFARNRVRHGVLPVLDEALGPGAREGLLGFAEAIERLEAGLASATAHIAWRPAAHAAATRGPLAQDLGGVVARDELLGLPEPLARRALWRLLVEGTGRAPQRQALDQLTRDILSGRTGRRSLPGAWLLVLRGAEILLLPPSDALHHRAVPLAAVPLAAVRLPRPSDQLLLPFAPPAAGDAAASLDLTLAVPGLLRLEDGRRIAAEWRRGGHQEPVPRGPLHVELNGEGLSDPLLVRFPRPGDRFHPLGAPGSRPLGRFLASAGVPREERARVPLVVSGGRILWVVGVRPSEERRVLPGAGLRLCLSLVAENALRAG